jgi:hypothetical protein
MRRPLALLLLCLACGQRATQFAGQWKKGVIEQKKAITGEQALIAFFDARYRAIAYEVWADDQLENFRKHRGASMQDYDRAGDKARDEFQERYGFLPPHFFPPFNDDFGFTENFTEAQVPEMWRRVLNENRLTSASQIDAYLANYRIDREKLAAHEARARAVAQRLHMEIWYAREYVDAMDGVARFRDALAQGHASLRTTEEPSATVWLERAANLGWVKGTKRDHGFDWQLTDAGRTWAGTGSPDDAARTLYERSHVIGAQ